MLNTYESIPGWFAFRGAYASAIGMAKGPAHFVEVGCWAGRSAVWLATEIINSGKDIKLTCVDHWQGSPEHQEMKELGGIYETFLRNTEAVRDCLKDNFQIVRSDSVTASAMFADNSLDFVWLDAGHDFDSVQADIRAWLPKLKKGGVLGGDDYPMEGVKGAVLAELGPVRRIPENGWESWWHVKAEETASIAAEPTKRGRGRPKKAVAA